LTHPRLMAHLCWQGVRDSLYCEYTAAEIDDAIDWHAPDPAAIVTRARALLAADPDPESTVRERVHGAISLAACELLEESIAHSRARDDAETQRQWEAAEAAKHLCCSRVDAAIAYRVPAVGRDSRYYSLTPTSGLAITVRVADHDQPVDWRGRTVGGWYCDDYGDGRHEPASINYTVRTVADVPSVEQIYDDLRAAWINALETTEEAE